MMVGAVDFFVSYTGADRAWAEWIAWQLEAAGYTTLLQAWDFRPGGDFLHQMQQATSSAQLRWRCCPGLLRLPVRGGRMARGVREGPHRGARAARSGAGAGLPAARAAGQPGLYRPGRPG